MISKKIDFSHFEAVTGRPSTLRRIMELSESQRNDFVNFCSQRGRVNALEIKNWIDLVSRPGSKIVESISHELDEFVSQRPEIAAEISERVVGKQTEPYSEKPLDEILEDLKREGINPYKEIK